MRHYKFLAVFYSENAGVILSQEVFSCLKLVPSATLVQQGDAFRFQCHFPCVGFQGNHHRALMNFVEAQAQYYAQCHAYMTELQKQLARYSYSKCSR